MVRGVDLDAVDPPEDVGPLRVGRDHAVARVQVRLQRLQAGGDVPLGQPADERPQRRVEPAQAAEDIGQAADVGGVLGLRSEAANPPRWWSFRLEPQLEIWSTLVRSTRPRHAPRIGERSRAEQQIRRDVDGDVVGQRTVAECGQPLE